MSFQEIYPVEYGSQYDTEVKDLMCKLISRLEQWMSVPDREQVPYESTFSQLCSCDIVLYILIDIHVIIFNSNQTNVFFLPLKCYLFITN